MGNRAENDSSPLLLPFPEWSDAELNAELWEPPKVTAGPGNAYLTDGSLAFRLMLHLVDFGV